MEPIELDIDFTPGYQTLNTFEQKVDEVIEEANQKIEEVEEKTSLTFNKVLNMARGAYLLGLGIIKSTGTSVSYFFRAMISAAFSSISILKPIISAALHGGIATLNPVMIAEAVLGLASLGVSIAAVMAAQQQQENIARGFRGVDMALLGIQQLIGTFGSGW